MPTVAASPQLSALGLRVLFTPRRDEKNSVILRDITDTFSLLDEIYAFSSRPVEPLPLARDQQLRVHRISMNSPLELLVSIPPAFIAGLAAPAGLTNFLAFFERVFNLPLAIKVDRDRLDAESHAYRAEQLGHELSEHELEDKLAELERRAKTLRLTPEVAEVVELEEAGPPGLAARMEALAKANEARAARARLKRELKEGRKNIIDVLLDPPEYVLTAKAFDLLLATPKYGRVKANRLLNQAKISPSKTIGGLSESQRHDLVRLLRR